jgi:hypothetical protein
LAGLPRAENVGKPCLLAGLKSLRAAGAADPKAPGQSARLAAALSEPHRHKCYGALSSLAELARRADQASTNKLLSGVNCEPDRDSRATLLHAAVKRPWQDGIRLLLLNGASPNDPDEAGVTPLMWAAWQGDDDLVALLQKSSGDSRRTDEAGLTATAWRDLRRAAPAGLLRLLAEQDSWGDAVYRVYWAINKDVGLSGGPSVVAGPEGTSTAVNLHNPQAERQAYEREVQLGGSPESPRDKASGEIAAAVAEVWRQRDERQRENERAREEWEARNEAAIKANQERREVNPLHKAADDFLLEKAIGLAAARKETLARMESSWPAGIPAAHVSRVLEAQAAEDDAAQAGVYFRQIAGGAHGAEEALDPAWRKRVEALVQAALEGGKAK